MSTLTLEPKNAPIVPDRLSTSDIELEREFGQTQQANGRANKVNQSWLQGVEVIGSGYDLFGDYAATESLTCQLFDWQRSEKKDVSFRTNQCVPSVIDVQQRDSSILRKFSGETIEEYHRNLSNVIKMESDACFFAESLRNDFSHSALCLAENAFCRVQHCINKWSLSIRADYQALRSLLYPDVKRALDDAKEARDFEWIFAHYGSHFISGLVMGGRVVLTASTNKMLVDRSYSYDHLAEAVYKSMTGQLPVAALDKYAAALDSFEAHSNVSCNVSGGDSIAASTIFRNHRLDFDMWRETISKSPDFVDFAGSQPVTGIWELCADKERAEAMQQYFESVWVPRREQETQLHADYLDALIVVYGRDAAISAPEGYQLIPVNLNEGVAGDFIYLCSHKAKFKPMDTGLPRQCITDIVVVMDNDDAPDGYVKIPVDLNRGTETGRRVNLCYLLEKYNAERAIKDVMIISDHHPDIYAPHGYIRIADDLNAGAGGHYIYLCYSRTA
ncbi:hypothetical protein VST7929_01110 [Vibrio stylophorae]|uniref:MACPF domain-containing protein n=1 Tax=Vibrio stylophorae TaxID=659351 RepID=A0ABN8DTD6_9VIBR|nr:MAC/perforin domain-containing protein [Vibrio stylophorae]CAH0533246.1 hypothetical protein VST7929_01110 [Vibrio stylophorae]